MLETVNMESVRRRDLFISGIKTEVDEDGTLVIECPGLDIREEKRENHA